jgi:hypothetical protein
MSELTQEEYNVLRVKELIAWRFPPKMFSTKARALFSTSPIAIRSK